MKKNVLLLLLLLMISGAVLIGLQSFLQTQDRLISLSKQNQKDKVIALFDNFVMSRRWNAKLGGVFVRQQKGIQPNPYMKNSHIYTDKGELLIMINPAWMTRQIIETSIDKKGFKFSITSLNPLNPENEADEFETEALLYFNDHKEQPYYFNFAADFTRLDFMGALYVTKECLDCHAQQEYRLGDIRGGIRISSPTELLKQQILQIKQQNRLTIITLIAIAALIYMIAWWLVNSIYTQQTDIQKLNDSLNEKFAQRTRHLQETQLQLADELQFQKMRAELYNLLISSDYSLDKLRLRILNNARQLLDSPVAVASEIDPENAEMLCQFVIDGNGENDEKVMLTADGNGGYPRLLGHALHDLQVFKSIKPVNEWLAGNTIHQEFPLNRVLSVSVSFNETLVGQLAVANKSCDYDGHDVELLKRLANFYALSMHFLRTETELKTTRKKEQQYLQEVKRLSITDPLTTLYNRRHFKTLFGKRLNLAKRLKLYFGLMILDIDYFKLYNDHYGHLAGDKALVATAEAISMQLRRSTEQAFRVGGEEFSCLVVAEDREEIVHLAESIRLAVKDRKIEHMANISSPVLTVSIGLKIVSDFQDMNFDVIYKAADDALYQAKHHGRDQVCIA